MPLYEYQCRECGLQMELLVRGDQSPQCVQCQSRKLEKLLSVPAAPASADSSLPICQPAPSGGCGLPQCGMGGCQFD